MHVIRMDFPAKNALSTKLLTWLSARLDQAGGEPVLLVGTGDAFSAGLDLTEIADLDAAGLARFVGLIDELVQRLFQYPAPVVAAVNGHAIAGGCVLALCCDYRVASDSPRAKFGLNEVALGVTFPPVVLNICLRRLDSRHVRAVLLGAGLCGVQDALRLGIVDEVAADAEAVATERLQALAAHPRRAYAHAKALLNGGIEADAVSQRRFAEVEVPIWNSAEVKQRIRAVLGR